MPSTFVPTNRKVSPEFTFVTPALHSLQSTNFAPIPDCKRFQTLLKNHHLPVSCRSWYACWTSFIESIEISSTIMLNFLHLDAQETSCYSFTELISPQCIGIFQLLNRIKIISWITFFYLFHFILYFFKNAVFTMWKYLIDVRKFKNHF